MTTLLVVSIVLITLALVFYSIGVWSERRLRDLRRWHVVSFWTGFTFDISGTAAMHLLASGPFDLTSPHTLSGQVALWLMFAHALWATHVSRVGSETARRNFHRFSIGVWFVWLIPYVGGMVLAMRGG